MADTVSAHKDDLEYAEIIDPTDSSAFHGKLKLLTELVKEHSGNVVFFTGAGISTAAGIPDFRSGLNSVTGLPAGKWCQRATHTQWTPDESQQYKERCTKTTDTAKAIPTKSHMAIVALQQAGICKGLISQNCDGLHRRSGFPVERLAELHGNGNLEYCGWCGKEYLRDFKASYGRHTVGRKLKAELWPEHSELPNLINPRNGNHYTGRRCTAPGCDGYLFDSTIDFGDDLPETHIARGYELAGSTSLCIVLGSTCRVSPACEMPISVGKRAQQHCANHSGRFQSPVAKRPALVVVNLQKTEADQHATLRIGSKIDDVMVPLMEALGLAIPSFKLRRTIIVRPPEYAHIAPRGASTKPLSSNPAIRRHQMEARRATTSGNPELSELSGSGLGADCAASWKVFGVDEDGTAADVLWNVQATFAPKPSTSSVTADASQCVNIAPVHVVLGQDCRPFKGRGGGRGNISKTTKSLREKALLRAGARVKQDGRPGDRGLVLRWPWLDGGQGGKALVRGTSGALTGSEYTVSADMCSVVDTNPKPVPTTSGATIWIANAGLAQGTDLEHTILCPRSTVKAPSSGAASTAAQAQVSARQQQRWAEAQSLELSSMALMFRSHYGEPPWSVPLKDLPQPGEDAKIFVLEYTPAQGVWEHVQ